jgi:hypothetical protein
MPTTQVKPNENVALPDRNKPATPVPTKGTYDQADYIGLCSQAGFADAVTAARVAWRETRGRPAQVNPQAVGGGCTGPGSHHATGMFQFVPACHPTFDAARGLTDPRYCASFAADVVKQAGWGAWKQGGKTPPDGLDASCGPISDWGLPIPWKDSHWGRAVERGYLDGSPASVGAETSSGVPGLDGAVAALSTADDVLRMMTSWATWQRVLYVAGGLALITLGTIAVTVDTSGLSIKSINPLS